jgi:imidazolonepropionase-like amidohydrolase
MSVESNIFIPMQSVNQGGVIAVRTSDACFQTLSSGGSYSHSTTQQSTVFHHDYNRADTWNHITLPVTTAAGKTTSFTSIHKEVVQDLNDQLHSEITSNPRRVRGEKPDGPAVGEVPAGDVLLPLLAMALAYIIIKITRNHTNPQTL